MGPGGGRGGGGGIDDVGGTGGADVLLFDNTGLDNRFSRSKAACRKAASKVDRGLGCSS